jgi:hypothetical protein
MFPSNEPNHSRVKTLAAMRPAEIHDAQESIQRKDLTEIIQSPVNLNAEICNELKEIVAVGAAAPRIRAIDSQVRARELTHLNPVCGELLILGKISNSPHTGRQPK